MKHIVLFKFKYGTRAPTLECLSDFIWLQGAIILRTRRPRPCVCDSLDKQSTTDTHTHLHTHTHELKTNYKFSMRKSGATIRDRNSLKQIESGKLRELLRQKSILFHMGHKLYLLIPSVSFAKYSIIRILHKVSINCEWNQCMSVTVE